MFIADDLNSRIKDMLDYIPNDDVGCIFDESVAYPSDNFEIPRKSKDKGCNKFGLSLIDICCSYDLHIFNERLFDDENSEFTCFANEGARW